MAGNTNYPGENGEKRNESEVMYFYPGQVCRKKDKQREIISEYYSRHSGKKEVRKKKKYLGFNIRFPSFSKSDTITFSGLGAGKDRKKTVSEGNVKDVRKEAGRRRKRVIFRKRTILTIGSIAFFILLLALIYKFIFVVRTVTVNNASLYSEDEIIDASGIGSGANLFSFKSKDVKEKIMFGCPFVESVEMKRVIPSTVVIDVTEEKGTFVCDLFGEKTILSNTLKVLKTGCPEDIAAEGGYINIILPKVRKAFSGENVELEDQRELRSIEKVISAFEESELFDRVTEMNFENIYDIKIVLSDRLTLVLGDCSDLELKIQNCTEVLKDEMFESTARMHINLTEKNKTSVTVDK